MMGGFDGMMAGWGAYGLVGGLINILLLVGLLGFAAWVSVRVLANQRPRSVPYANRTFQAEEVLRERFARGELSAEEFERGLRILRGQPTHESREDFGREAMER